MTPPFTDARMPEVVARVAFRLVERHYKRQIGTTQSGADWIIETIDAIECFRGALPHSALLAALFATRNGMRMARWRDEAVMASRAGYGFRRCWYADYKATRRDPRVTNRGVM